MTMFFQGRNNLSTYTAALKSPDTGSYCGGVKRDGRRDYKDTYSKSF